MLPHIDKSNYILMLKNVYQASRNHFKSLQTRSIKDTVIDWVGMVLSVRSQKIIVVKIIREWSFSFGKQHLSCSFWQINLLSDYTSLNTRRHLEIFCCLRRERSTLTFDVIENLPNKSVSAACTKRLRAAFNEKCFLLFLSN